VRFELTRAASNAGAAAKAEQGNSPSFTVFAGLSHRTGAVIAVDAHAWYWQLSSESMVSLVPRTTQSCQVWPSLPRAEAGRRHDPLLNGPRSGWRES